MKGSFKIQKLKNKSFKNMYKKLKLLSELKKKKYNEEIHFLYLSSIISKYGEIEVHVKHRLKARLLKCRLAVGVLL